MAKIPKPTRAPRRKPTRSADAAQTKFMDGVRQHLYPPEYRIGLDAEEVAVPKLPIKPPDPPPIVPAQLVCEFANCLWHLKTKHFGRTWSDAETSDDDPRIRRALGRLSRAVDMLRQYNIEVVDPTGERYRPGAEGFMRPIDFQRTAGITFDKVEQTVRPIVMVHGQVIQSGEVFVAVPIDEAQSREPHEAAVTDEGDEGKPDLNGAPAGNPVPQTPSKL